MSRKKSLVRMLIRAWQFVYVPVSEQLSWQGSRRFWRSHYIRQRHEGRQSLDGAKRIAVFAHFSKNGRFADYVVYLLKALHEAGFVTVVVSNSKAAEAPNLEAVQPWCARILRRKNVGYDFGAWKDGIFDTRELQQADQVLLINDSIFGPFRQLSEFLNRCDGRTADIWGMTDSFWRRYHLQSYFLLIGGQVVRSKGFEKFWRKLRYVSNKRVIIAKSEIGFSQAMLKAGFRIKALFPYRMLTEAVVKSALTTESSGHPARVEFFDDLFESVNAGRPLNSTHYFWEYLILNLGFPFIKRELLEKNPVFIPFLSTWRSVIASSSNYPLGLIETHLQTSAKDVVF